jgi:D-sedoheptulose 7-phosphate isomerase
MKDAILRKANESAALQRQFFEANAAGVERCVQALAERFSAGGRLLCIGNGGSACDAQHATVEFQHPILEKRRPLPAVSLANDVALLTAIGNDTDFSRVFADQVELWARPADALLAISTSGASANVNRAVAAARKRGLLTIGFAGRDGGTLAELCEIPFVVASWSIHRIQEVHTTLLHLLWDQLQVAMGEDDVL